MEASAAECPQGTKPLSLHAGISLAALPENIDVRYVYIPLSGHGVDTPEGQSLPHCILSDVQEDHPTEKQA